MKILITGMSGFIGKWVAERAIDEGHAILGMDIREMPYAHLRKYHRIQDILDLEGLMALFRQFQPDAVVHLAATTGVARKKIEDYGANIDGVKNICAAVRETPSVKRVIYTSTQLVCRVGYTPESDTDYCPSTLYGQSKIESERIVREEDGGGAVWCIGRPTTVWGPYMKKHYQGMLRAIRRGRYFHTGRGKLYKSYSYAGNIAFQYMRLIEAPSHRIHRKTFYLADYEPLSLRDYTIKIQRMLDTPKIPTLPLPVARMVAWAGDLLNGTVAKNFPYNSFRMQNILTEYIFDMRETERVCGPLPYGFNEGVRATVRWYLNEIEN